MPVAVPEIFKLCIGFVRVAPETVTHGIGKVLVETNNRSKEILEIGFRVGCLLKFSPEFLLNLSYVNRKNHQRSNYPPSSICRY